MSQIGEQRSGVLKMLARTFDVGHLAEAFDVFFEIIKKQDIEIHKLQIKTNEVDHLKENVAELTKCLKNLEYNIQDMRG